MWNLFGKPKPTPKRRRLEDVQPGESIMIEYNRMKYGKGSVECINNEPENKKMLIKIRWGNWKEVGCAEEELLVLKYSNDAFSNFSLLNPFVFKDRESLTDDNNLAELQKKMNEALEKEQYEIANDLQKKIDKLMKK
jgi:hypothetical protein